MVSLIDAQREILLGTIRQTARGDWKVLVVDADSRRLIDNVIDEDQILNENITNIEQIEQRRQTNRDVDAIYLLTPQPHIVDCVMADFDKRKYRRAYLIWTSLLHPALRDRIDKSHVAREQIALFKVLNAEFFPRESHLVTFRDPWSFPILFHPACNGMVRQHLEDIAQKIVGVCVALGEYPVIRYYRPPSPAPSHEAAILCSHLARFVQDELDLYAKFHEDFPPMSNRPRGTLFILDRSLDLFAPILHEFTYQAMAHDLLPIRDGDKVSFRTLINDGQPDQQEKDLEIAEKDKIWVENRHRHMKDTIERIMADFHKFLDANPNFTAQSGKDGATAGLNAIKDMLAGLPEFQQTKEAYALHLGMATESMNRFQKYKLPDLASVEQMLATGLDEDYKRPKGIADQVIRMLDEPDVIPSDRLRLLMLYVLYRDGILPADLLKLVAHAQLPPSDEAAVRNLEILGASTSRKLKDSRPRPPKLFEKKPPAGAHAEEYLLSRYQPVLQDVIEAATAGTLDMNVFPYTKPPLELAHEIQPSAASLRSAKPTWAKSRTNVSTENRQRILVFMAGGATYSEARVCYETGAKTAREVYMISSHLLTPQLFIRQLEDLSKDKRRLGIPADQPNKQAPSHLFEPDEQPRPAAAAPAPPQQQQHHTQAPPTAQMGATNLNGPGRASPAQHNGGYQANSSAKLTKEPVGDKKDKKHRFGFGKKG